MKRLQERLEEAQAGLLKAAPEQRKAALSDMAQRLMCNQARLVAENSVDLRAARARELPQEELNQIRLGTDKVKQIADSLLAASRSQAGEGAAQKASFLMPGKDALQSFEAVALRLLRGQACVLSASADSQNTHALISALLQDVLAEHGLPRDALLSLAKEKAIDHSPETFLNLLQEVLDLGKASKDEETV